MSKKLAFIQNNQALTTSLKVAETFDKNHAHVMRDIRDLISQVGNESKIGLVKMFEESSYTDKKVMLRSLTKN